jgi:hypothetical protein
MRMGKAQALMLDVVGSVAGARDEGRGRETCQVGAMPLARHIDTFLKRFNLL